MASPQKEKGYTAIANELMDALGKTKIPGQAWQILCVVLRNTYGWNRKKAHLSFGYIAKATGIERTKVNKILKTLQTLSIISVVQQDHTKGNIWQFNKDYKNWGVWVKKTTVALEDHTAVVQETHKSVGLQDHQQSNKAKINKTTPPSTAGILDEVNLIFKTFYETINPQISFARKDSRDAALWLINKYGFDNAHKAAKYACLVFEENYAPQIKTPAELKDKWANLVKYKNKQDAAPER